LVVRLLEAGFHGYYEPQVIVFHEYRRPDSPVIASPWLGLQLAYARESAAFVPNAIRAWAIYLIRAGFSSGRRKAIRATVRLALDQPIQAAVRLDFRNARRLRESQEK
jgi:hypothetical protein